MQVTIPTLRKLDTLVDAEVVPLLENDRLLLRAASTQHVQLTLAWTGATSESALFCIQLDQEADLFDGLQPIGEAELLLLEAEDDVSNVRLGQQQGLGDAEEAPELEQLIHIICVVAQT